MNRLEWLAHIDDLDRLPESPGVFFLRDAEKHILTADCTSNLRAQCHEILAPERDRTAELLAALDYIEYKPTDDLLAAAIELTTVTSVEQQRMPLYNDFVYLGVRMTEPPYTTISNFTLEDYYYVGPFPSRFMLHDVLATLAAFVQTPACDGEKFPCERHTDRRCLGFCVESSLSERMDYFLRHLLLPNELLLDELREKREKLLDDLAFEDADLLGRQLKALDRYYDHLCMQHVTRYLDATIAREGGQIHIEKGRIAWVQKEKALTQVLARPDGYAIPSREYLAFDKSQYSERRAVYLALRKEEPDLVAHECQKSVQRFSRIVKGETNG